MSRLLIDPEEESFVFENEWEIAIPFSFVRTEDRGLAVTAFPLAAAVAEEWLSRFGEAPLTEAAFAFLFEKLPPLMAEKDYFDTRHRTRYGYIFRAVPGEWKKPPVSAPVLRLGAADEAGNRTTYDLAATADADCIAFGVKEEGAVLSLAVTHEPLPGEGEEPIVEVGVETAPAARRRGLATASLIALTEALVAAGVTVEYRHFKTNRGSGRVALRAGLRREGEYYYYCFEHRKRR